MTLLGGQEGLPKAPYHLSPLVSAVNLNPTLPEGQTPHPAASRHLFLPVLQIIQTQLSQNPTHHLPT